MPIKTSAMYIVLKYGDDKSYILNANCKNLILLQKIKKLSHCKLTDVIDLCDELGNVKHARSHLGEYGVCIYKERETLILLKVTQSIENSQSKTTFTPMLKSLEKDEEFLSKVNPRFSKPEDRMIKERKFAAKNQPPTSSANNKKLQRRNSRLTMSVNDKKK